MFRQLSAMLFGYAALLAGPLAAQPDYNNPELGVTGEGSAGASYSGAVTADLDTGASGMPYGEVPEAGELSLSFTLPDGGNSVGGPLYAGFWYMVGSDINLGVHPRFEIDTGRDTVDDTRIVFGLSPVLRYYLGTFGKVRPFARGVFNFAVIKDGNTDVVIGLSGGLGAEWFVVRQFSLLGHIGLGMQLARTGPDDPLRLATLSSALAAQIYFDL